MQLAKVRFRRCCYDGADDEMIDNFIESLINKHSLELYQNLNHDSFSRSLLTQQDKYELLSELALKDPQIVLTFVEKYRERCEACGYESVISREQLDALEKFAISVPFLKMIKAVAELLLGTIFLRERNDG
jgi:hypothetical protein